MDSCRLPRPGGPPSWPSGSSPIPTAATTAASEGEAGGLLAVSRNPFAGETEFRFLRGSSEGELVIFDVAGRRVRSLEGPADSWRWDGRDEAGRRIRAGLYLYRCRCGEAVQAGKLAKLR